MLFAWYVLMGDEDIEQSDCENPDYYYGTYWFEANDGDFYCFYLTRFSDTQDCGDSDPTTCVSDAWQAPGYGNKAMDNGIYDKLTNTYGLDLQSYYENVINCTLMGDGTADITASTSDSTIPRCFYSLYCLKGYLDSDQYSVGMSYLWLESW